jgi:hypothetical protein
LSTASRPLLSAAALPISALLSALVGSAEPAVASTCRECTSAHTDNAARPAAACAAYLKSGAVCLARLNAFFSCYVCAAHIRIRTAALLSSS